jgi:hypothetical protein
MATYVNDLRLKEIATGDEAGTWGTSTNTNLELIAEAFSFGTEAITTNADTHTTTIADGSTDPGRSIFLKYTGTLDSACTITIGPNTVSKLWLIENATSGSQAIIIKQGSGATITVPNGQTKAIYSDGAGSGGAMVDAFQDLSIPDLFIDDDLTFTSDSAVITFGADGDTTLTHTDGSGLTLNSTNKIMFNDASQFIQGSSATVLSLGATDEIDLTATAIDVNGTIDVSGNATLGGTVGVTGVLTANAGVVVDNITIDGTEIDLSSGDLTIDVAGDIILDTGGDDIKFKVGGTDFGSIAYSNSNLLLTSAVSNGDILLKGNDGGSTITALTLDMSAAGIATFNSGINIGNRGSASDPTLQSAIDPDTGVFWGGGDILGFSTGGSSRLQIASDGSLSTPTLGTSNVRLGVNAGNSIVSGGNYNVVVGDEAGTAITTGDGNVAIGYQAGDALTTGIRNIAIGKTALGAATTSDYNTAIGYEAMGLNTTGTRNTALGVQALYSNVDGDNSVAIGYEALFNQDPASNVDMYNVAVGYAAGKAVTTGTYNTFIGGLSGDANTTASNNVAVGYQSLTANTTGANNTAVGQGAMQSNTTGVQSVAFGSEALDAALQAITMRLLVMEP